MEKKDYHKITVADMAPHVHSFLPNENKVDKILAWLKSWIQMSLDCGKIHPYDLLPSKADLACHIGVSQGTIQNVFRLLEDEGYVESKQRVGTYIKSFAKKSSLNKFTSKREIAIEIIKKFFSENDFQLGQKLPSMRKLAQMTGISNTTLRMSMTRLVAEGVLEKKENDYFISNATFQVKKIQLKTLVEKTADILRDYILSEFKSGDRLPSNEGLKKRFKVSSKTIHDALKILSKEGVVQVRRGQYGTFVLGESELISKNVYFYEKIEQKIRQYIIENCSEGDKLPPIRELAKTYETSEKTIKKALDNLSEDGYIAFARGRYGGTFVLDIPQSSQEAYKWLALNADYMSN